MIDLSEKARCTFAAYGVDSHWCAIEPICDECGQPFVVFHIANKAPSRLPQNIVRRIARDLRADGETELALMIETAMSVAAKTNRNSGSGGPLSNLRAKSRNRRLPDKRSPGEFF
jgi:hypothetical protein